MGNLDSYNKAFRETFGCVDSDLGEGFTSETVEKWDSVTQMALVGALEDAFGIMLNADDIFEITSYEAGKAILKKYDVEI